MPAVPSRITVRPGRIRGGSIRPPGDKSITHRAYLLGALAEGVTRIEGANPGTDCEAMLACAGALGAEVRRESGAVAIRGCSMSLTEPERPLDCGNSGTVLRLLAGPLAAQPFLSVLVGDASLHRRPVDRVIEPLRRMGARLWARGNDRWPPLVLRGGELTAIDYESPVNSAQVASCVLLAGLFARGRTTVRLGLARDHTERMLPAFGVPAEWTEPTAGERTARSVAGPARLRAASCRVPGDFSAAAFLLAAAAITPGASVTALAVGLNPTRTFLLRALEGMGATVQENRVATSGGERVGEVTVTGPDRLAAFAVPPEFVPAMVDEVPAWAVLAALARGTSVLSGAAELRVKESDRLAALARGLGRLGVRVEERPDGLAIEGGAVRDGEVDAGGDHRIAMAFAVLGTRASGPVTVTGCREIATSYPGFVESLRELGAEVETAGEGALRA